MLPVMTTRAFDGALAATAAQLGQESRIARQPLTPSFPAFRWATLGAACLAMVLAYMALVPAGDDPAPLRSGSMAIAESGEVSEPDSAYVTFDQDDSIRAADSLSFASLSEGVSAVSAGGTLKIARGESSETGRIVKRVRLEAIGGPVKIGLISNVRTGAV